MSDHLFSRPNPQICLWQEEQLQNYGLSDTRGLIDKELLRTLLIGPPDLIFSIIWSLALLILWNSKPDGSSTTFQTTTTINQNFQYKPEYKMRINWENACKETKSLWQLWMLWDVRELFTNNERWKEKDLILFLKRKKTWEDFKSQFLVRFLAEGKARAKNSTYCLVRRKIPTETGTAVYSSAADTLAC